MNFLINNKIEFICSSGELKEINTRQCYMLNRTCSLLLEKIIKNGNGVTSREEIFHDVFEVTNSKQTDGNLNQCIASIRKVLNELGQDNIISTIPKSGFSLDREVNIVEFDSEKLYISRNKTNARRIICISVLVLVLVLMLFLKLQSHTRTISAVVNLEKCTVNFLTHENFPSDDEPQDNSPNDIEISDIINTNNINCKEKNDIYIYRQKIKNQTWTYIGKCTSSSICSSSYTREY